MVGQEKKQQEQPLRWIGATQQSTGRCKLGAPILVSRRGGRRCKWRQGVSFVSLKVGHGSMHSRIAGCFTCGCGCRRLHPAVGKTLA